MRTSNLVTFLCLPIIACTAADDDSGGSGAAPSGGSTNHGAGVSHGGSSTHSSGTHGTGGSTGHGGAGGGGHNEPGIVAIWTNIATEGQPLSIADGTIVRFGKNSFWLYKPMLNGALCDADTFWGDPQPSVVKECQVQTGTEPAPPSHAGPTVDTQLIPPPTNQSFAEDRVQPTNEVAPDSVVGAFRISCKYSHMSFNDPIVFPNQPDKAHLHTFFGNTGADAFSTAASLVNSGNSTCNGGTINRSAYWVPSLIDPLDDRPVLPTDAIWYYKGFSTLIQSNPIPQGLRIIAGDRKVAESGSSLYHYACETPTFESYNSGSSIPFCQPGDVVRATIRFPACWDGVNVDSADHASHMHYHWKEQCPPSHPVALPEITLNIAWRVEVQHGPSDQWRLSSDAYPSDIPGGYSMHADWFNGWKPEFSDVWGQRCVHDRKDCHAHLLGDGRAMY
jgi:hypothetical protein